MKGQGKGGFAAPGDYIHFKSQVPLHKIPVGSKQWRYYDFGPKVVPPLICLPGTAGTADVHYKQIMALSMKGYRVISVDIPRVWNHLEWIHAFEKFLDAIDVHHIHIYGTSLGGFLAQLFAQHRPRRVKSLVLSNTFLDTRSFSAAMPWAPVVSWSPSFLLKRYVLTGIRDGPHEPFIADSVDFVVSQVEALSRDDLASRLTLTVDSASVGPLQLPDASITIMDTNDYSAIPQELKDEVGERYPGARRADLKTGGDFPFLSRPDEVNLHLLLHLRRVRVEPRSDLVPGAPRTVDVGNPYEEERRYFGDQRPKTDMGILGGTSKSEVRDAEDDDGDVDEPPKYDEVNIAGPPNSDEQEEENDPPIADETSCRGPLRGDVRGDKDDPPEDDQGSSTPPSRKEGTDNAGVQPKEHTENSGSSSKNGESQNNAPKDSEASSFSPAPDYIESSSSNEHLLSDAVMYITGFDHAALTLNQDLELLLSSVVAIYLGSLYIACCSLFICRSRQLVV